VSLDLADLDPGYGPLVLWRCREGDFCNWADIGAWALRIAREPGPAGAAT
jgi:hypothetical protein